MVMESRCHSYNNHVITISQGELRDILQRIEADFVESKAYLQSLTSLENSLGKSVANLPLTLTSLGREAIKLTFRELAKYCNIIATTTEVKEDKLSIHNPNHKYSYSKAENMALNSQPQMPVVGERENQSIQSSSHINSSHINSAQAKSSHINSAQVNSTQVNSTQVNSTQVNSSQINSSQINSSQINSSQVNSSQVNSAQTSVTSPFPSHNLKSTESIFLPSKPTKKKGKKLTKLEMAAQLEQEREQGLREIGVIIHQARIKKGWSIEHLHSLTFIAPHQIIALESGDVKSLPEDVYLRGFISRLAEALQLDTQSLLQKLPQQDIAKTTLPSWYHDPQSPNHYTIKPIHLYLGYSTLVAGALGGLALINPQETRNLLPELPSIFTSPSLPKPKQNFPINKSGITSQMQEVSRSIAPPESAS